MNILIAEDQRLVQMTHQAVMAKWGFGYGMASNGAEAVEFAKARSGRYLPLCLLLLRRSFFARRLLETDRPTVGKRRRSLVSRAMVRPAVPRCRER
jgi:hypothetical protein